MNIWPFHGENLFLRLSLPSFASNSRGRNDIDFDLIFIPFLSCGILRKMSLPTHY